MGRPANAEGRQTRAAFMNAALELFSQKGYFGTSLRDIAKVVGVRESALYNHFSSKDQLFEALITAASEERIEQFHEITEGPVDDVRRLLETIVLRTLESFRQPRQEQLFRILMADGIRLTRDGRLNLMERLSAGQVLMRQLFVRLMREGHLRAADPDVLMLAFTGPMLVWRQLNAIGADHSVLRAPAAFARGARRSVPAGRRRRARRSRPPTGEPPTHCRDPGRHAASPSGIRRQRPEV